MKNIEIGILGSGNVAHHLAIGLFHAGLPIRFICSRNVKKEKPLPVQQGLNGKLRYRQRKKEVQFYLSVPRMMRFKM
ncbi:MAG: NAD(P)-binding domain-containing protein [Bacteroidetes bacterium]|nr:NAD(P)-binding domain-containing protein [Bacteroidota bacterium]